jgi:hypothetical protein
LSKLRKTGLKFTSVIPSQVVKEECELVITTRKESAKIKVKNVAIEDLDNDQLIMKGQILAKIINKEKRELLIGIDPGSRIGVAVFFQDIKLASFTLNSVTETLERIRNIIQKVPNSGTLIRIGNGEPQLSRRLAYLLKGELSVIVEIVDEKGTSINIHDKELTRDQSAATRIALRKGVTFN